MILADDGTGRGYQRGTGIEMYERAVVVEAEGLVVVVVPEIWGTVTDRWSCACSCCSLKDVYWDS